MKRNTLAHTKIHNHTPQEKAKNIQPNNLHHTLHMAITKILIEFFIITHSYPRLHAPLNSRNIAHPQPGQNIWLHAAYKILQMERYWPSIPHKSQHDCGSHPLGQNGSQRGHEYNHHSQD